MKPLLFIIITFSQLQYITKIYNNIMLKISYSSQYQNQAKKQTPF